MWLKKWMIFDSTYEEIVPHEVVLAFPVPGLLLLSPLFTYFSQSCTCTARKFSPFAIYWWFMWSSPPPPTAAKLIQKPNILWSEKFVCASSRETCKWVQAFQRALSPLCSGKATSTAKRKQSQRKRESRMWFLAVLVSSCTGLVSTSFVLRSNKYEAQCE